MIGGIVMVLVALWVYQSAVRAKVNNALFWVGVAAVVYLVVQVLAVNFNVILLDSLKSVGGDVGNERELMSIGDRKTQNEFQGFGGILLSTFMELLPPVLGVISVALVRTKFMLKEALTLGNLFSGFKELFVGIKNSFKTQE